MGLKAHSTPRFVKLQSKEDTLYLPLKSPDYWGVHKRVSSFQNLLDFWGRKRTNQFSILLDCLIQEQSYLRPIVFDHVCLICSNLSPPHASTVLVETDPCVLVDANVRHYNITTHVFQVHWYMEHANMWWMCWTLHWSDHEYSIICCSDLDLWR